MAEKKPPAPLDMPTLKAAFKKTFKGCGIEQSKGVGVTSHHVEVNFDDFEVRVIMSSIRPNGRRDMSFRFQQRVKHRGQTRKVIHNEVQSTDPAVILAAIEDVKATLLGWIYAIHCAFVEKPVYTVSTVDDIFREDA